MSALRLPARVAALHRGDKLLLALVGAHLLVKVLIFPQVMDARLVGDETSYVDGGRALSNALRDLVALRGFDTAELSRNVVSSGWFMPGMMFLVAPIFVVDPDASIAMIRAWLGLCSTALFLVAVIAVRRQFGIRYAAFLLVFPGLVPMWLAFSYGAWGDLTAGLVILVMVTVLVPILRRVREGVAPTYREGAVLGLLAIAVVYFRSSAAILSVGLCLVLGLVVLFLLRGRPRTHGFLALVLAGGIFVMVLAPWSVTASKALGSRVMTTTSVSNVTANTFGDPELLCFGPCDPNSTIWFTPVRYAREVARATGEGEVEVQVQMSEYARRNVTTESYSRDVLRNMGSYLFKPAGFAIHLQPPNAGRDLSFWIVAGLTVMMYFPVLLLVLLAMFTVFRTSFENRWVALVVKLGVGALLVQPFVHIAGARYWTTAAPLWALAALLYLGERHCRERGIEEKLSGTPSGAAVSEVTAARWLDRIQWVLIAGFIAVPVLLLLLAI